MQARNKIIFLGLLCCSLTFLVFSYIAFAGDITVVGEVNDTYQIVAKIITVKSFKAVPE
jgi:hypothetical protein